MTRIARPAEVRATPEVAAEETAVSHSVCYGVGPVQTAIRMVFDDAGPGVAMNAGQVYAALGGSTNLSVVKKVLQRMGERGEFEVENRLFERKRWNFYWLPGAQPRYPAEPAPAAVKPVQVKPTEPVCAELAGNLRVLRSLGADDHVSDADEMVVPINPPFIAEQPKQVSKTCRVTEPERATFAFCDDGRLEIYVGYDTMILQEAQVSRLVKFLGRIAA